MTQTPYDPSGRRGVVDPVDLAAVVLLIAGVIGLTVAAYSWDWRLGLAVPSTAFILAGILLGTRR